MTWKRKPQPPVVNYNPVEIRRYDNVLSVTGITISKVIGPGDELEVDWPDGKKIVTLWCPSEGQNVSDTPIVAKVADE